MGPVRTNGLPLYVMKFSAIRTDPFFIVSTVNISITLKKRKVKFLQKALDFFR